MKNPLRILIAEDEPLLLKSLQIRFGRAGYEVWVAGNGEEALSILEQQEIDAVITDLSLPGADGFEIIEKAISHQVRRPYILVSSGTEDVDQKEKAMAAGADEFVCKPFSLGYMFTKVNDAVTQVAGS